ncbi:MAG: 2Fe-2S iron-sulfur cluster binding domain-containing protein [Treponema sp.]|jgi:carbon-monoxide dehydrogenase small subunit|nr:2Fe-2S iron-sulfur cluster binding domain-containing protein [Treponema sp.]
MTISFILNGEDVTIHTDAEKRLIDILRGSFQLLSPKSGCFSGRCGSCSVMLNGEIVKSCLIPAFKIHGCEVITIEGFSQTGEYLDIVTGFAEAGVETCAYCDTGKILAVEALLSKKVRPGREEILPAFHGIKCRCTEPESLIKGVECIAEKRQRRLYGSRHII